nr:MAG TPA: hypothetical protein [Caudoviricetes sp.]
MTNRTLTDNKGISWMRVNKRRARALYDAGSDVIITPANIRPFNPWRTHVRISSRRQCGCNVTFDSIINEYEYYNCNSNEVGRYPAYYVKSEVLE